MNYVGTISNGFRADVEWEKINSNTSRNVAGIVLKSIQYANQKWIVYTCLRSSDILVKRNKNKPEFKTCDFGSATFTKFGESKNDTHDGDDSDEEKETDLMLKRQSSGSCEKVKH